MGCRRSYAIVLSERQARRRLKPAATDGLDFQSPAPVGLLLPLLPDLPVPQSLGSQANTCSTQGGYVILRDVVVEDDHVAGRDVTLRNSLRGTTSLYQQSLVYFLLRRRACFGRTLRTSLRTRRASATAWRASARLSSGQPG